MLPLSTSLSPLLTTSLFSSSESLFLFCNTIFFYFLDSTFKLYTMLIFLCLTYFTKQIISKSIQEELLFFFLNSSCYFIALFGSLCLNLDIKPSLTHRRGWFNFRAGRIMSSFYLNFLFSLMVREV